MNNLRKDFALPICSLDFSLKNSTTTSFSISWFSTDCTQTILTHTWGPDKQISFYHVPVKWMVTDHKQHLKTFMINLPEVCWPLSCCTILPHFNIICFEWCDTWKVEICRKHTQTFLNDFTDKDFCDSRHGYNNIRRNGGPTCYTLHELKNKKAEIVSLNGETMHHIEHNPNKF